MLTLTAARKIAGSLGYPSKMPGTSYGLPAQAYVISFYARGKRRASDGIDVYVDNRSDAVAIANECVRDAHLCESSRWIVRATVRRWKAGE